MLRVSRSTYSNQGFSLDLSNEELDRYFEIAKALGVTTLSAIFMLDVAEKVAPFADKHKCMWASTLMI
jgi:hypothetical protein